MPTEPPTMPKWQDTPDGITQVLLEPWSWLGWVLPAGLLSDGTSSPWWARLVVPRRGRLVFAAYLHDYLLTIMPRDKAAKYYLYALKKLGASKFQRRLRYRGVRLFDYYRKHFPKK